MNTEEVFLTNLSLQAEGLTAIEGWVIACIIFVFGALLEYTVILLKLKLKKVLCLYVCSCIRIPSINSCTRFNYEDIFFLKNTFESPLYHFSLCPQLCCLYLSLSDCKFYIHFPFCFLKFIDAAR